LPADRAFADTIAQFAIPRELPEALLEGLAWDIQGRRYETPGELLAYAARVAGAVGAMMSLLMQRRDPAVVARACDLGVAMQLTNIARDVGEDARAGRLYLPQQWLREAGLDPQAWLANPRYDERISRVVRALLTMADVFYARSVPGIAALPKPCRPGIHVARLIYAEIGREVERNGFDSISRRAVVSPARKLRLLAEASAASFGSPGALTGDVEPATRFLVEAVAASSPRAPFVETQRRGAVDRAVWLLDLFERLERRDQLLRGGQAP
jgi:phytoene synthase